MEAERDLERSGGPLVMQIPNPHSTPLTNTASDRGRIVFVPRLAYGQKIANMQVEDMVGWRAVVEGTGQKGLRITTLGEEGTCNARVLFKMEACHSKGIIPLTS